MTVPFINILTLLFSALISLALPTVLFLLLRRKKGASVYPFVAGMLAYYVSVFVLQRMVSITLMRNSAAQSFVTGSALIYALYMGLMTGIFEETGRFVVLKVFAGQHKGTANAIAYGLGHSAFACLLAAGLGTALTLGYAISINTTGLEQVIAWAGEVDPQSLTSLTDTGALVYLLAGFEQIATIAFHIAASVMIWLAATKQGPIFLYPLTIALRVLISFPMAFNQYGALNNQTVAVLVMLVLCAAVCFLSYRVWIACRDQGTLLEAPAKADQPPDPA